MNDATGGVAAVDRALTILDAFRKADSTSLSLAAIAAQTGFYKSTILRLIASLEHFGYIRQMSDGKYKLGPTVSALGALYRDSFQLSDYINPALEKIVSETNESASFIIQEDDHQLILFRRDTNQRVRDHMRIGDLIPLSLGGASVKILKTFANYRGEILDPKTFCQFSFGERNPEMAGIAVPIIDGQHTMVGTMTITGPIFRINKKDAKDFAIILQKEAIKISIELGASHELFENIKLQKNK